MKKKIVVCCLLVTIALVAMPMVSAFRTFEGQSTIWETNFETQSTLIKEKQVSSLGNGYLLFWVFSYSPGQGINPYQGANVSARSLFHFYNGTTDEKGICVLKVNAPLFRENLYFVKVSIVSHNHTHSKRAFIHMRALQVEYKESLFVVF